jgi:hypothetical protein
VQQVETDPGDDRGQPRLEVADLVGPCPADALPGVLDGVVGVGQRAQHPVGHRPQMGSVGLEVFGQPLLVVHGHGSSSWRVISGDPPTPVE